MRNPSPPAEIPAAASALRLPAVPAPAAPRPATRHLQTVAGAATPDFHGGVQAISPMKIHGTFLVI